MPISLGELATRFDCDLDGDANIEITHVASLLNAGAGALSFLSDSKFIDQLASTTAAAVIVRPADVESCPVASLISDDPYATYAHVAAIVHPPQAIQPGIHASAVVAASSRVSPTAQLDAHVVVGENSVIGDNVYIGPGCVIGNDCEIGEDCRLIANVTMVRNVVIGKRGALHPGVVIGADGFGNARTSEGWLKVPQLGGVRIGNDVEIGSNSTVDCGALDDTVIEDGVRIDNLCMIAHNVHVGAHTAMASMTGIAGSAKIGKRCMFGGQSGSVGHITICDDAVISGRGMVTKDITEPGIYASNFPVDKVADWNKRVARLRRIESLYDRVGKLEKDSK